MTENTARVYVNTSRLMLWREIVCVVWDLRKTQIHCLQKKKMHSLWLWCYIQLLLGFAWFIRHC